MKIASVRTHQIAIPFSDGGRGEGIGPSRWHRLDLLLVEIRDEEGNIGWGEGFGYFVTDATRAIVDRLLAPSLIGSTITDVASWNLAAQQQLHLFGRYGVTLFGISAVDLALWDLQAKRAGLPLHRLLTDRSDRLSIPFYASLVRYADVDLIAQKSSAALEDGFSSLKLHERTLPEIRAARRAVGRGVPLSVDVNCAWSVEAARDAIPSLRALGVSWLEEPVFPPEDAAMLASLRGGGVPIAAGENWSTATQFRTMLAEQAVDFAQPSVTKLGGISEFVRVARVCDEHDVALLPHSPYFGPGFFASLHLAAALPSVRELEWLYVKPEAWLVPIDHRKHPGHVAVPESPGLGFEPDPDILARYSIA